MESLVLERIVSCGTKTVVDSKFKTVSVSEINYGEYVSVTLSDGKDCLFTIRSEKVVDNILKVGNVLSVDCGDLCWYFRITAKEGKMAWQ